MPGATLISYARNRTYSPSLGRWLQQDPNGSGQTTTVTRFRGESDGFVAASIDITQKRRDGLNFSGYLRCNPIAFSDSSGLYSTEEAVEDFYESNFSLPTPGTFIQGALSSLVTDYAANLEWDIEWSSDWSMDDEAHTRNSNVWVYLAIGNGIYDAFEFGFGDYKINVLDPVSDYLMAGKSGGGGGKGGGKGPRGSRPNPRTHPGSHVSGSGPYSHLPDHPSVGAGKDFTATQRKKILNANASRNGGRLRSDVTGRFLSRSPGSPNSAQVDHIKPQSRGGSNSNKNAQVVEAHWNQSKGNRR
jgi:hypothetical protein